jgi:hypothetical protein
MSLLLPILLLGLAQPAEQPPANQPTVQMQTLAAGAQTRLPGEASGSPDLSRDSGPSSSNLTERDHPRIVPHPFDRIEPDRNNCDVEGNCDQSKALCLTLRSYYFDRQDDLAPEYKGMTTCEDARQVRNRNAKKGQKARLVPAN